MTDLLGMPGIEPTFGELADVYARWNNAQSPPKSRGQSAHNMKRHWTVGCICIYIRALTPTPLILIRITWAGINPDAMSTGLTVLH